MRILFLIIIFIFFSSNSKSQTWCAPGTTWHYFVYSHSGPAAYKSGVEELKYTGTVSVNSVVCKRIVGTFTGIMPSPFTPVNTYTILDLKTFENNQVYFIYDSNNNVFDTLVNFNATIGDKWRTPNFASYTPTCSFYPRPIVTVLDTGHVIINSMYLKKVVVHNSWAFYNDTIIEKIAGFNQFLTPYHICATDFASYGKLMCYEDNNFSLIKKSGFNNCFYDPTSLEKKSLDNDIILFPNPSKNKVILKNNFPDKFEIGIKDISGRDVSNLIITDANNEIINIEQLNKGIYFFNLKFKNGKTLFKKLIKE